MQISLSYRQLGMAALDALVDAGASITGSTIVFPQGTTFHEVDTDVIRIALPNRVVIWFYRGAVDRKQVRS